MTDIKSLPLPVLKEKLTTIGEKPYRANQIYEWLHKKLVLNFAEMTNLPLTARAFLEKEFYIADFSVLKMQKSDIDDTRKYLFALPDGDAAESVFMRYKHGNSVCISSQVGCRMGCTFCASALGGLKRSLTAGEMLEQVYAITRDTGERVSNVVVMGMGEPLDNYDELLSFIRILSDESGLNISQRNITVSTCGLVPKIYRLADEMFKINLAISLHAADDEKRVKLMPIAKVYSIDEILDACRYYFMKSGRRITFEYSLINDMNDDVADAIALKELMFAIKMPCHINLIPVNWVEECKYSPSIAKKVNDFKNILEKYQINVTIRREMGSDIDAACGQLRFDHTVKY